ncbi:hypothetical protein JB92DRAFT_3142991 [Gautieria morchelliformis]|nr:hypothetical protein JB92DRAFT_3142991 [Gautieria morchelliformis]
MRLSSQPQATVVQHSRSMGSSDNSHSSESESAASPTSNYSSNTSSGTHFASLTPLPKGAQPPRVSTPTIEGDVGFNTNAKRKARVLRKPYPPPSITNATSRSRNGFYTQGGGGRPSSSARVQANWSNPEFFPSTNAHHRRSLLVDSTLSPVSSYGVFRHSHSFYDSYERQPIGKSIPFTETAEHIDDTLMPSTNASERPPTKLAPVQESESSRANKSSVVMQPPFMSRNKPLPKTPVISLDSDGLASPDPMEPLPSHRLLQYRYHAAALHSEEGQAAPVFDHFVPRLDMRNSTGHGHEWYAHSDIGHRETWSDSGHTAYVTRYTSSDVHYHVSGPHSHHNPEGHGVRSHNPPRPFSTVGRLDSSFPEFSTPLVTTQTTHSMPIYPSEPPKAHTQGTRALTRRLSWGQRIIRTLSTTLLRKDFVVDKTITDPPSPFHPRDKSAIPQPTSVAHSVAPLLPQSQPLPSLRKLRKRAPSSSNSLLSKPARFPRSRSTPALYPYNSRSRELVLEMDDVASQEEHSEFHSDLSHNKNGSLSNPARYARISTPSAGVPWHSGLETSTPARGTQSQPTTPASSTRKLLKRHGRRKIAASSPEEHLAPLRTQLPLNLDSESPRFSNASRSHSVPNICPSDPPSERFLTSQHVAFPTQSPSKSPDPFESPVDEHRHHYGPSQSEDHPSLLHPRSIRRWTLAVFDAPDEQLVEELDRLRNVGWAPGFQGELVRVKNETNNPTRAENQEPDTGLTLEKDELEEWLVARKALMICREIVRTEKSYREGLIKLQRGKVSFVYFHCQASG